jgi:predicted PurR-regulated permease PerM
VPDERDAEVEPAPSPVPVHPGPGRWQRILAASDVRQVPIRAILFTVAVVVAVFLVGKLLYRLRDVVLLLLAGAFIALVLNPLVVALQNWKVRRRGAAVAVVTLWAVLVFAGLAVAFGYPLVNSLTHLANALPTYIMKAQEGQGWIGHLLRHYHVQSWVKRNSPKLVSLAEGLGKPALSVGKGAVSILLALATTFAYVVLLLLEAPKMKRVLLAALSPERAQRWSRIGGNVSRSVSGFVVGDFATSLIAGTVVFVTLTILNVPFAFLWGLWVALVDFLPTIGGALAGIPTVLFALAHSLSAGIITAIVFIAYTQIENHVLNPVVMSRTVKVNPLLVFLAVIVGAEIGAWVGGLFGGFVCALLAVPVAAALQIVVRELWTASASPGTAIPPVAPPSQSELIPPQ